VYAAQEIDKHRTATVMVRCAAAVHHLMHKRLAYAYNTWHAIVAGLNEHDARHKTINERAHTLLCKMMHHNIAAAWHLWVEAVGHHDMKQRAAKLLHKVVGRVLHQQLWSGFDTWTSQVQEAMCEEKALAERVYAAQEIDKHRTAAAVMVRCAATVRHLMHKRCCGSSSCTGAYELDRWSSYALHPVRLGW